MGDFSTTNTGQLPCGVRSCTPLERAAAATCGITVMEHGDHTFQDNILWATTSTTGGSNKHDTIVPVANKVSACEDVVVGWDVLIEDVRNGGPDRQILDMRVVMSLMHRQDHSTRILSGESNWKGGLGVDAR